MRINGGCHCGAVRFTAEIGDEIELLDCNCSMCSRTGYLHLIVPHERFTLLSGRDALVSYRFNTGAAEHLFCSRCGIKSFYQPRSHPQAWSLNWRTVDESGEFTVTVIPFDGRNWESAAASL